MLNELISATKYLASDPKWVAMLAENLYWASCEGFLQSSLLGAINASSAEYVADRERTLTLPNHTFRPDLLLMHRADHDAWWEARDMPDARARSERFAAMVRAVVMIKLVWADGKGAAQIEQKVMAILSDLMRVTLVPLANLPGERFVCVLATGLYSPGQGSKELDSLASNAIRNFGAYRKHETAVDLLTEYEAANWGPMRTKTKTVMSSRLMWVQVL